MRRTTSRLVVAAGLIAGVTVAPLASAGAIAHHASSPAMAPVITKVWPHTARAGQQIHVTGSHLTGQETVRIGGRLADFHVVSAHRIVALVPGGARTGRVVVSAGRRTAVSPRPLVVRKADTTATITFTPSSGPVGSLVTISSTGGIGGIVCDIIWGNNISVPCSQGTVTNGSGSPCCQIVMAVPADAGTGPISLSDSEPVFGTSTTSFKVSLGVSLTDADDHPGTTLTVNGSGFNANEVVELYAGTSLGGYATANGVGSFSYTTFEVPTTAQPGTLYVTAEGERSGEAAQAAFTVNTNWGEHGFNAVGDRYNPYENTISPSNVAGLGTDWTATTGNSIFSSPAVANGIVYIGSEDDKLYAYNATTGTPLWTATTGNYITSSPAVANGIVYIGSFDDKLYAYNATTGTPLWTATTSGAIYSSPAVANGIVYIGSEDDKLYAYNATTGTPLWTATTGNSIDSSPAIADGIVYIGSDDDKLYAYNATTGTPLWTATTGSFIFSSPAVADGIVYIGSEDDKLYAYNATTGTPLWTATTGSYITSSPAVANGIVYIGSFDDKLYAYNATTGTPLWTATTSGVIYSSPAVANGIVYIGSEDDKLYAYNATTGTPLWTATTGNSIDSSPAVANGIVYIGSYDDKLHAYDLNGPATQPTD